MTVHEVLVKARNATEQVGFDVERYGCSPNECGTPKCALGWLGWFTGYRDWPGSHLYSYDDPTYQACLEVLLRTAPLWPEVDREWVAEYIEDMDPPEVVETLAFRWTADHRHDLDWQAKWMQAWLDRAIAATAPAPDFASLDLQQKVTA